MNPSARVQVINYHLAEDAKFRQHNKMMQMKLSNFMVWGCLVCWGVCSTLFILQFVDDPTTEVCGALGFWMFQLIPAYFNIMIPSFQEELVGPSPDEFPSPSAPWWSTLARFLSLVIPLMFVSPMHGLCAESYYMSIYVVALIGHTTILFMRFRQSCYGMLVCLLLGVVTSSYSARNRDHPAYYKHIILALSLILIVVCHAYYHVRRAEVAEANDAFLQAQVKSSEVTLASKSVCVSIPP